MESGPRARESKLKLNKFQRNIYDLITFCSKG